MERMVANSLEATGMFKRTVYSVVGKREVRQVANLAADLLQTSVA